MDLTSTHENTSVAPTIVESKDDFQSLDPRQIRVDQIASLIFTAVVGVGALVGLVIIGGIKKIGAFSEKVVPWTEQRRKLLRSSP